MTKKLTPEERLQIVIDSKFVPEYLLSIILGIGRQQIRGALATCFSAEDSWKIRAATQPREKVASVIRYLTSLGLDVSKVYNRSGSTSTRVVRCMVNKFLEGQHEVDSRRSS